MSEETKKQSWQDRAAAKRAAIRDAIPPEWRIDSAAVPNPEQRRDVTGQFIEGFLSEREREITGTSAEGIVQKTSSGAWSAVEVARAFCHRAAVAHQLVSCLHESFFSAALRDAAALDAQLKEHGKPSGPLHGLPVSLKDQFHVRGVETTMGYVGWIGTLEGLGGAAAPAAGRESEMVRALRQLGAVLYVKTAVPHTLMCGETVNNIVGYVPGPRNRLLSAGGSSGGEGALIALGGSPAGFGTDIGGSIRIPAAFNGLCGLRPSAGRLPYEGMANSMDGQNSVLSVVGPLAGSVGALRLLTKALLGAQPWLHDPLVVEMPWREEQARLPEKLTFGVLWDDGYVAVTPPVRRALEETVEALKKAGHEVIDWTPKPEHQHINTICFKTWMFDGGRDIHSAFALSGEPPAPQIARSFGTEPAATQYSATEIAAVNVAKREAQKTYMEYWNGATGPSGRVVDAVISPCAPFPSARPEMYYYYGYSTWVNLLDYTSVVVPITKVDKSVDLAEGGYEPKNEVDKLCWGSYDHEIYHDAPVGLQIVGRRLQEEKTLAVADVVMASLKLA